jgi:hypothetical protein
MSGMSNYLEGKLIDHIFRGSAFTMPSNLYIALMTTNAADTDTGTSISNGTGTGVEVSSSSTGYARQAIAPTSGNWSAASASGITGNSNSLTYPQATANWGTIVGIAICDQSVGGNMLFYGALSVNKVVNTGDTFQFTSGQLQVQIDN